MRTDGGDNVRCHRHHSRQQGRASGGGCRRPRGGAAPAQAPSPAQAPRLADRADRARLDLRLGGRARRGQLRVRQPRGEQHPAGTRRVPGPGERAWQRARADIPGHLVPDEPEWDDHPRSVPGQAEQPRDAPAHRRRREARRSRGDPAGHRGQHPGGRRPPAVLRPRERRPEPAGAHRQPSHRGCHQPLRADRLQPHHELRERNRRGRRHDPPGDQAASGTPSRPASTISPASPPSTTPASRR